MATAKTRHATVSATEMNQSREPGVSTSPVRVGQKTKARLGQLLKQANKDRLGRKIKADDLIGYALSLIGDVQIAELSDRMLSNKDRVEILFRKLSRERRGMSREEFLGMLLDGTLGGSGGATGRVAVREVDGQSV